MLDRPEASPWGIIYSLTFWKVLAANLFHTRNQRGWGLDCFVLEKQEVFAQFRDELQTFVRVQRKYQARPQCQHHPGLAWGTGDVHMG